MKVDASIDARRRLLVEQDGVARGYFDWLLQMEQTAAEIIESYPQDTQPIPADLHVARGVIEHANLLREYWQTVERENTADPDMVEAIATLSASLMEASLLGWTTEGKKSRHRVSTGGRISGEARSEEAAPLHQRVHTLRSKGRTQKEIAQQVGISDRQVRKILNGK